MITIPSFSIHLSVAKKYLTKNNINNIDDFYKGVIAPDLVKDKIKSHYGIKEDKNNLIKYVKAKVLLIEFLKDNTLDTDYNKGVFLHLITDYLFYNTYFNKEYLVNTNYKEIVESLYYSYNVIEEDLEEEYKIKDILLKNNIDLNEFSYYKDKKEMENILLKNKLFEFINKVSNINLYKYREKILENNCNVLPDEFLEVYNG